jgi:ElaB/YqjD/DUF883 family membrane-anchored ribosome-binding protein
MHASSAQQPSFESAADPAVDELHRIVSQAEALLDQIGNEGGEAADAVRERVTQTLEQARSRLAATAQDAERAIGGLAARADQYVRAHPWESIAIAALLGGALTWLITRAVRR